MMCFNEQPQVVKGIAPGMTVKVSNTDEFIYLDISHALLTSCLTAYREWLVRFVHSTL